MQTRRYRVAVLTSSLVVYIYRLRRKIVAFDLKIDTMVHVGYRLIPAE